MLFTECDYKGDSYNLCDETKDFKEIGLDVVVKSLIVPEGWELELYNDTHFKGDKRVYK